MMTVLEGLKGVRRSYLGASRGGKLMQFIGKHLLSAILGLGFMFSSQRLRCLSGRRCRAKGRMELLYGDANVALAYFQQAAELNPNYRLNYSIFPEGVWTYVGRANFAARHDPGSAQSFGACTYS